MLNIITSKKAKHTPTCYYRKIFQLKHKYFETQIYYTEAVSGYNPYHFIWKQDPLDLKEFAFQRDAYKNAMNDKN